MRKVWFGGLVVFGLLVGLLGGMVDGGRGVAQEVRAAFDVSGVDWVEPRGLNVVDLVGYVPEEYLQGAIISFSPGYGIVRYASGSRVGDTVVVTTTVYPRWLEGSWSASLFGCLGQWPRYDQWPSAMPAAEVRVFSGGTDVTVRITGYDYIPADQVQPVDNSGADLRYGKVKECSPSFTPDGALELPANMGCEMWIPNEDHRVLTAVYTMVAPPVVSVEVLGTETFTFHSYIGPGGFGLLDPLANQMRAKYPARHDRFIFHVPSGADYVWITYPPTPVDTYTQFEGNPYGNVDRPSGGTYRVDDRRTSELATHISVDHVNSMGLPLYMHWSDSDVVPGATYLDEFDTPTSWASLEYLVPDGVSYDPCMLNGTCPDSLLDQIYNATMTARAVYLRVTRVGSGLVSAQLRQVGPGWSPGAAGAGLPGTQVQGTRGYTVYLPLVLRGWGGRMGWFTSDGRMVDAGL